MCRGCYIEYGSPDVRTDTTPLVVKAIEMVYKDDFMGGACHIVVDDWNIEDEWIDTILDKTDLTGTERYCMKMMRSMTFEERATALAIYDGLLTPSSPDPQTSG